MVARSAFSVSRGHRGSKRLGASCKAGGRVAKLALFVARKGDIYVVCHLGGDRKRA
jgi:hypothetical protein